MQIITDIVQGSEEWLRLRLGVATASNFDRIITPTGKFSTQYSKYAQDLASEMLLEEPEESYKNPIMARGNELEPEARESYEEFSLMPVEQVTFITCGDYGYSPDGLVGEEGLIEIKCPNASTHTKYLADNILPMEYKPQVQGGLYVSGREWCDFVSYHPKFIGSKKIFVKRVFRDEEFIAKLKVGIEKTIAERDRILKRIKLNDYT